MPGCVFRVKGEHFQVDEFLEDSDLQPYRVLHEGELICRLERAAFSEFHVDVSFANADPQKEIADAIAFLTENEAEIRRLSAFPGVVSMCLDFGYYCREVSHQIDYLPPELIEIAGRLGLGIQLSHFPMVSLVRVAAE